MKIAPRVIALYGLAALGHAAALPSPVVELDGARVGNVTDDDVAIPPTGELLWDLDFGTDNGSIPFKPCTADSQGDDSFKVEDVNLNPNRMLS